MLIVMSLFVKTAYAIIEDDMPTPVYTERQVYNADGTCNIVDESGDWQFNVPVSKCSDLKLGEWSLNLETLTIYGTSVCTDHDGEPDVWKQGDSGFEWVSDKTTQNNKNNRFCWCMVTKYMTPNNNVHILTLPLWISEDHWDLPDGAYGCARSCADTCAMRVEVDSNDDFRKKLFN